MVEWKSGVQCRHRMPIQNIWDVEDFAWNVPPAGDLKYFLKKNENLNEILNLKVMKIFIYESI